MADRTPARVARPASAGRSPGRRRGLLWRYRRLLFLAGLLGVAGLSGVAYVLAHVPLPVPEIVPETTIVYDASGQKLAELNGGENRVSKGLDEVPQVLVDAVLAAEDRDFFSHPGIDLSAIARATIADLRGRPLQGGSTITQQYVKNVYVGDERSLLRKLREATLAVKLEQELDKELILERYLNTIYFGRGAYGVQAASRAYFAIDVGQLDLPQAAFLAGLIRAPETAEPERDGGAEARRRRDLVLTAMQATGAVGEADATAARAVPVAARPRADVVKDRISSPEIGTQHFIEYVRRQLVDRYGADLVNTGGLRVTTSLDLDLQRAAYDAVYGRTLDQPDDPAGALVALDTDGRVRAMVGGRRPPDTEAQKTGYDAVNFATGTDGGGGGRQAGSAFKPFALAEAVAEGFTVESTFDSPSEVVFPDVPSPDGGPYTVRNYDGAAYGRQNLVDATRVSSNTVYAQLTHRLGVEKVAGMATRLGITSEIGQNLSIALGAQNVSVLDMADAYLTFATRGEQVDPTAIVEVRRSDGSLVDRFGSDRVRVLAAEQADVVNHVLREVVEDGTGRRADPGHDVAGKTGTTQDYGDAWFVGYTPKLAAAVWMGFPEGQSRPLEGVHGVARVAGGTLPADIFRRFMEHALERPELGGDFVAPADFKGEVLTNLGRIRASRQVEPPPTTTTTAPPPTSTTAPPPAPTTVPTTVPTTAATTVTTAPPPTTAPPTTPPPAPAGPPDPAPVTEGTTGTEP